MTQKHQIYKCPICDNIVEVIHEGVGQLICCSMPMELMEENTTDAATEKHVPVVEKTEKGFRVVIGEVEHPMAQEHYIEWIQLIADDKAYRQFLHPGQKPEAEFFIADASKVIVREYCNIHGLWKK